MRYAGRFALGLLAAALSQALYADENKQALDEVVVSGSRSSEKLSRTPQSIGAVSGKVLKRDKPKTMGDVINRIPGVWWNDLGNEQHSMSIRQPISTNAMYQYLEDGIPIRPLGVFNHNSMNELNLSGSERVEVVKGAASSLYGSNAVGGAVNFLTARPSLTPEANLGVRNESVTGYRRADYSASNTWGDLGLRIGGYSSRRADNNWQEYSRGKKDSLTLRGDYALAGGSLLRATLSHNNLDTAMPGSLGEREYVTRPGYSYNTFAWRKDKTTRMNLAWEGETVAQGVTTVTLFGRQNDHGQLPSYTISACAAGPTCPTGFRGTINNNHVSSIGLDMKHQQDFAALDSRLVAGVYLDDSSNPYRSDNLDVVRDPATLRYVSYAMSTVNLTGVRNWNTGIRNVAFFGQFETSPVADLRLVLGGRNDDIRYNYTNYLTPGANFGAASESRSFSHFSPKLGAAWQAAARTTLFANASQGFVPPEVLQLYGALNVPNLRPATYNNYELGLRQAFLDGAFKLDAAVYRLDGRDTILTYSPAVGVSTPQNAGRTRSQGMELALSAEGEQYDARLGVNLASHRFVDYMLSPTQIYSGKEMPQAPGNTTSAEIGYKPLEQARVALGVVYQSGYWMNNDNTVRYAGHMIANLNARYKMAGGLEFWAQGRNLTNRHYADSASSTFRAGQVYTPNTMDQYTPGTPRSLMVGLNYNFDGK